MESKLNTVKQFQRILRGEIGRIFLYGAGYWGERVNKRLPQDCKEIFFFDKKKTGYIETRKIYKADKIDMVLTDDDVVLVTVEQTEEVEAFLEKKGVKSYLICNRDWMPDYYKDLDTSRDFENVVEFYLVDAFEVYHFAPIVRFLETNGIRARLVMEAPEINTVGFWFNYEDARDYVRREGLAFVTKCNPWAMWSVTTQEARCLGKYLGSKIHLSYGMTMRRDSFVAGPKSCYGFDYKWIHGEIQKRLISKYFSQKNAFIIGYPKYDSRWNDRCSEYSFGEKAKEKPILIFLPTWDEYSSISIFEKQLTVLKEKFFIVGKLHHCTERLLEKAEDREKMRRICDVVLPSDTDFREFIGSGDVIVADAKSGASTEAILLNPEASIVFLWPEAVTEEVRIREFIPEIEGIAPIAGPEDDIEQAIENSGISMYPHRTRIVNELYAPPENNPMEQLLAIMNRGR